MFEEILYLTAHSTSDDKLCNETHYKKKNDPNQCHFKVPDLIIHRKGRQKQEIYEGRTFSWRKLTHKWLHFVISITLWRQTLTN